MTREDFFALGTDVFNEFLPKAKSSDRKQFLEVFLEELEAAGVVDIESEETPSNSDDIADFFDNYDE